MSNGKLNVGSRERDRQATDEEQEARLHMYDVLCTFSRYTYIVITWKPVLHNLSHSRDGSHPPSDYCQSSCYIVPGIGMGQSYTYSIIASFVATFLNQLIFNWSKKTKKKSKKLKGISAVLGPPLKRAKQHREYCYPSSVPSHLHL